MAEEKSAKTRRRVKNPETFRERAEKAAEASEQPQRSPRIRGAFGRVLRPVFAPIGRGLRSFFGHKAFRPIRKVLRMIGKVIFPAYFRNSWRELKLVTWPTWRQSRQLTFAVLVFAIIFGGVVALVDYGLDKVFRQLLLK